MVFSSTATNLVPSDTNARRDVFVRDRQFGTTERVSVDGSGVEGNDNSVGGAMSADGRFVAFFSDATSLVPGDTNGFADVFVRDRQLGTTERISVDSSGGQGNQFSYNAGMSADGRFVAFGSLASNLVPADTNANEDAFVHDRQTGMTERVSLRLAGGQAPRSSSSLVISSDGRFAAFSSFSKNLVPRDRNSENDIFLRHRLAPVIYSITPTSGIKGSTVTIEGTHFDTATKVKFSGRGAIATFTVVSPTMIKVTVPSGAKSGPITVTNPDGTAKSATFAVTT
jgi:hypothetical protein